MKLQVFKSWDEIQPGDELVWGTKWEYHVVFSNTHLDVNGVLYMHSSENIKTPVNKYEWNSTICNNLLDWIGWRKVVKEYQYDPNQQGDTDDDI